MGWKRGEWKVENRHAADAKAAAIHLGVGARVDDHLARVECPLGTRQLAGRNRTIVDDEVIGPRLLNALPGKRERTGRRQNRSRPLHTNPDRAHYVVKLTALAADVVGAVT